MVNLVWAINNQLLMLKRSNTWTLTKATMSYKLSEVSTIPLCFSNQAAFIASDATMRAKLVLATFMVNTGVKKKKKSA
jgi:hypothetical protein